MKALRTTGILLAAFVVGVLSQHMSVLGATAKSPIPNVVKARSFALVDRDGNTAGIFSVQNDQTLGSTAIVLYDARGQIIWRASNGAEPVRMMR